FSSRRRHTRFSRDWSSDVCSSDLVYLKVEGKDVLHSFWVPALAGKIDVVPGRINTMWLDAKKPGMYQGKCAELCGASHALMDFRSEERRVGKECRDRCAAHG